MTGLDQPGFTHTSNILLPMDVSVQVDKENWSKLKLGAGGGAGGAGAGSHLPTDKNGLLADSSRRTRSKQIDKG